MHAPKASTLMARRAKTPEALVSAPEESADTVAPEAVLQFQRLDVSAPAANAAAADVSAPAATADADETALLKASVDALFESMATDGSGKISRKELATKLRADGQIKSLLGIADASTVPEVLHVMRILEKMGTDQNGDTYITPKHTREELVASLLADREVALLKARVDALFESMAKDGSGEISRKELAAKLRADGQIESLLGIADASPYPAVLLVKRILDEDGDTYITPQELKTMRSAVKLTPQELVVERVVKLVVAVERVERVEAARRHNLQETLITYAERMHAWVQTFNGASILLTALVAMVYTALSQREDGKCAVFPFLPENTTTTSYYLLARFVAVAGVIFLSVVTIWYDLTLEVADPILERLENPAPADQKGQWWSKYETRFRSLVGVVAFVSLMFAVHSFHLVLQQGAATCTLINALPFAGALVALHCAHRLLVGGNEAAPEKRETLSKQYWGESRVVRASMNARASGYVDLSDDEENATTRQCCGTRLRPANAPTPKPTNALACCGCSRARCSLIWFSVLLAVVLTLGQQLAELQTRSQPSVAVRQITLEERHAIMRGITITPARRQLWDAFSSNISGLDTRVSRPVLTEMASPPEGNHLQRMGAPPGTTATISVERRQLEAEIGSMADLSALQCNGAVIEVAPDTSERILRYTAITVGSVGIGFGLAVYAVTAAPGFARTCMGNALVITLTEAGAALANFGARFAASMGVTTLQTVMVRLKLPADYYWGAGQKLLADTQWGKITFTVPWSGLRPGQEILVEHKIAMNVATGATLDATGAIVTKTSAATQAAAKAAGATVAIGAVATVVNAATEVTAATAGTALTTGAVAAVVSAATAEATAAAAAAAGTTVVTSTVTSVGTTISVEQALVLGATELTVGVAGGGYVVGRGVTEMIDFVFGDPPQDSAEDACTLQPFVFNMREFDPDYDGTRSYTQRLVLATSADGLQDIVELVISPRTKMDMQTNPNVLRLGASPIWRLNLLRDSHSTEGRDQRFALDSQL